MHNILLVVDGQVDFTTGALGSEETAAIIPNVAKRVHEYEDNGNMILYTQDTHFSNYLETSEGKHLPYMHCEVDTPGWEIVSEILPRYSTPKTYWKKTFGDLFLPNAIRNFFLNCSYDGKDMRILIVGWVTNICVVSNALILKAALPEAEIIVDAECCAGTSFDAHIAALKTMESCQITVINKPEEY